MRYFGVILLFPLLLAGCSEEIEPGTRPPEGEVIRGLEMTEVGQTALTGADSYVGTVESQDRSVLVARVDGQVSEITVSEGEQVDAGELLLTIADTVTEDRLREAQAALSEARGRLQSAESRYRLAQKTFERYERLAANEAVTAQEMDQITSDLEVARQELEAARAAVERASSARNAARTTASFNQVKAPYPARVVDKKVQEGSTVMPGTPLMVLDRSGEWLVRTEIPESMAGQVKPGDPVQVEVPAAGKVFDTRISEVLPTADPQSRTFEVKSELPDDAGLASGLFARMIFPGQERQTILVPQEAVVRRGQLTGVYVLKEDRLHYRLVKTGRRTDGKVEILSGLRLGETIVTRGAESARSGARVEG